MSLFTIHPQIALITLIFLLFSIYDKLLFGYSFILNSLTVPVSEENTVPTLNSLRVSAS